MATIKTNEIITNNFIDALQQAIIPWKQGWFNDTTFTGNYVTKKQYSLGNIMLVGRNGAHLSYKQLQDCKGTMNPTCPIIGKTVRTDASHKNVEPYEMTQQIWDGLSDYQRFALTAKPIMFWKMLEKKTDKKKKDGTPVIEKIPYLRYSLVTWVGNTTLYKGEEEQVETAPRIESCEALVKFYSEREHLPIIEGGNKAYYSPSNDEIHVPKAKQFKKMEMFYSTEFHEMTHSTGAEKRLNRNIKNAFGTKEYAREELVAEIGAAFLTNKFGIRTDDVERDNTAYIQGWIEALTKDPDLIIKASAKAQKAMEFILNGFEEPKEEPKEDPKPSKPVKAKRYLLGYFDSEEVIAKQFDGYDVEYNNTLYFVHKSPKGTCWQVSCPRTGRLLTNRLVSGWNTRKEAIDAIHDIHPMYIKVLAKGVAEHEATFKKCICKAEKH